MIADPETVGISEHGTHMILRAPVQRGVRIYVGVTGLVEPGETDRTKILSWGGQPEQDGHFVSNVLGEFIGELALWEYA